MLTDYLHLPTKRLIDGYHLPDFAVKHQDWQTTLAEVKPGDLVFLDPPYPDTGQAVYGSTIDWPAFFDAIDDLSVPFVLTLVPTDLAKTRLEKYQWHTTSLWSYIARTRRQEVIVVS